MSPEAQRGDELLQALQGLRSRAILEAVQFWRHNGFRESVPIPLLLGSLQQWVARATSLPRDANLAKMPTLQRFFQNASGRHVADMAAFAAFLRGKDSIADALQPYIGHLLNRDMLSAFFRPVDLKPDLVKHVHAYVEGTREWVFDEFNRWANKRVDAGKERVFWVQGGGGLGKSVIAAQLVQRFSKWQGPCFGILPSSSNKGHHQQQDDSDAGGAGGGLGSGAAASGPAKPVIAAHFFCRHDDADRNDPRRVIATLAHNLALHLPMLLQAYQQILSNQAERRKLRMYVSGLQGTVDDASAKCVESMASPFPPPPPSSPPEPPPPQPARPSNDTSDWPGAALGGDFGFTDDFNLFGKKMSFSGDDLLGGGYSPGGFNAQPRMQRAGSRD